jgi:peroxiredoxin/tetratricopeptide (TPR) repeat protein
MVKERTKVMVDRLQKIVVKYPNDVEAKASLALANIGQGSAYANEMLIQDVLAKTPMHPGAHHASIHNWDGVSSEQAVRSCEKYGKSAPGIGHALHMPGHIYSKIGMWHEAAIAMDSATRTELRYMNDRLALPFETWNYPHNRNYLCYIQEQLGMANAALQGAKDMLAAPHDPDQNPALDGGISYQGRDALIRNLIKFEKWDEILKPGTIEWKTNDDNGKLEQAYTETLAYSGLKRIQDAKERLSDVKTLAAKIKEASKSPEAAPMIDSFVNLAEGIVILAQGKHLDGQRIMLNAADFEQQQRDKGAFSNDPPSQPWPIMRLLGDEYRSQGNNSLAIECYERALKNEPNDGFTISGLALAHNAAGNKEKATYYAGRLDYVWSQADPGLKWMDDVKKLALNAKPIAETIEKERVYVPKELDKIGPMNWQPFAAPSLQVVNKEGKPVSLKDYAGKNVVLVFFLGEACVHCVGQLKTLNERASDFDAKETVILAVCSATPESIKASTTLGQEKVVFLSDKNHENARRFSSYDDFEEIELHSTILIDKKGCVRWKRTGGDPFTNVDFLLGELAVINASK